MSIKKIFSISVLLAFSFYLYGQVKHEREFRIKEHQAPALAISFIHSVFSGNKVRWYAEVSNEGKTIEAKLNHNGRSYSIEFDLEGNILEVEFEIKMDEIPESTQTIIENKLKGEFDRYRISRIQEQRIGSREGQYWFLNNGDEAKIEEKNFEITIRGTKNRKTGWFEFLFSNDGQIISKVPVVFRNIDILEF